MPGETETGEKMENLLQGFQRDELVSLRLRGLFERRGFLQVRVNKFEDYGLYIDNKNFLQSESIITFMDMDGRLMALKPDVTLSIVKNMPAGPMPVSEKLYYIDEVYRLSRESREYTVHSQIGVELIGEKGGFSNIEIVDLALESLHAVGESFVLDISHLGFVSGLLEGLPLNCEQQGRVLRHIHEKNLHDLAAALDGAGVEQGARERILALGAAHGNLRRTLPGMKALVGSVQMEEAYRELEQVAEVLLQNGWGNHVNLDFSAVNDLDYYNGLIFRGYVEGIPSVVLTGGRYDNLMRKMGKQSGAIGFAVSLERLNTYLKGGRGHDVDLLVTYDEGCDYRALLDQMKKLRESGKTVRAERAGSDPSKAGFTYGKRLHFGGPQALSRSGPCETPDPVPGNTVRFI